MNARARGLAPRVEVAAEEAKPAKAAKAPAAKKAPAKKAAAASTEEA